MTAGRSTRCLRRPHRARARRCAGACSAIPTTRSTPRRRRCSRSRARSRRSTGGRVHDLGYRVATNAALDEARRRHRAPVARRDRSRSRADRPARSTTPVADRLDVDAALAQLTPEYRAAVALRDLVGHGLRRDRRGARHPAGNGALADLPRVAPRSPIISRDTREPARFGTSNVREHHERRPHPFRTRAARRAPLRRARRRARSRRPRLRSRRVDEAPRAAACDARRRRPATSASPARDLLAAPPSVDEPRRRGPAASLRAMARDDLATGRDAAARRQRQLAACSCAAGSRLAAAIAVIVGVARWQRPTRTTRAKASSRPAPSSHARRARHRPRTRRPTTRSGRERSPISAT